MMNPACPLCHPMRRARPVLREVLRTLLVVVTALPPGAYAAAAQWQPKRIVEIAVGVTPGGPLDISARLVQQIARDRKLIGVPIVVMNRPGANNALAWMYLNQHPGDAHYVAMTLPNIVTNRLTGSHPLSYTDVTPLAQLNSE